ncbi:MAG: hypothetical protein HZA10_09315 [Nitrospirae bacterium]|nr:hypothetical protein [Nitrospirota bacterium]
MDLKQLKKEIELAEEVEVTYEGKLVSKSAVKESLYVRYTPENKPVAVGVK